MINKIKNLGIRLFNPEINYIVSRKLTYLTPAALKELGKAVQLVDTNKIVGDFIEAGSAYGGSAIYMSKMKQESRAFHIYDMFGMIPPPSERDGEQEHERYETIKAGESKGIDGNPYYGYEENLYDRVVQNFKEAGLDLESSKVQMYKGSFQDTMKIDHPVALAHIDCDWYDSVYYCLEQIMPRLSVGGVIILDDYYHWESCRNATKDFLKKTEIHYKTEEGERYRIWRIK